MYLCKDAYLIFFRDIQNLFLSTSKYLDKLELLF